MNRLIFITLCFCAAFLGCSHTVDKLSRFNAGHVNARDLWVAMAADEIAFRKATW
jgi:hypothetical protein